MKAALKLLFPSLGAKEPERFRDARVRDSVAKSEQALTRHELLMTEMSAIEQHLPGKARSRFERRDTHR